MSYDSTKDCEHFKTVKAHKSHSQENSATENPGPLYMVLDCLEIKDTCLAGHHTLK